MATFNITYAPGTSLTQMIGFQIAGQIWSAYLEDDVTINLHVAVTDNLPTNVIGGALPRINAKQNYDDVLKKLSEDVTSADDFWAVGGRSANNSKEYEGRFDLYESNVNRGELRRGKDMNVTSANSKALGVVLSKGDAAGLDGYILMRNLTNTPFSWSYDYLRTGALAGNALDFLSTALHEIGHVLGFVSGIDRPGWLNARAADNNGRKDYLDSLKDRLKFTTPLDLFRYSPESGTSIDLSLGGNPYFSIDGGRTAIAQFATGKDVTAGGDGFQASHWKGETGSNGIMNPTLTLGQRLAISGIDLRALDVIGWDIASTRLQTPINLAAMLNQARQQLAQRLGVSVAWLDANPTLAAQRLQQDRTQAVLDMITNSEVYEGRRNRGGGSWQEILDVFAQEGAFAEIGQEVLVKPLRLRGTRQNDKLQGGLKGDRLLGLKGDDHLIGGDGADLLRGDRGQDWLQGSAGRDTLRGGADNDLLDGGTEQDLLIGGQGSDRFVVALQSGRDIVRDFKDGVDRLQLAEGLTFEQLSIEQQGRHTVIRSSDAALLLLRNVNASLITVADFV